MLFLEQVLSLIYILKSLSLASPHQGMRMRDLIFRLLGMRSKEHHPKTHPKITLTDAKHDILENYSYLRKNDQIPIIAYNPRNEDLSPEALRKRGYDQNGWPFAPWSILCRPNGYDEKRKSVCFACFKQCKNTFSLEERSSCPYWRKNKLGFTRHMKIEDHPRLILEIPRGTERYEKLFDLRPA